MPSARRSGLLARLRGALGAPAAHIQMVRDSAGTALVQGGALASSLVLGVVLARGLGAEGYGVYAYAIAVLNVLLVVAEIGVPTLLMREIAVNLVGGRWSAVIADLQAAIRLVIATAGGLAFLSLGVLLLTARDTEWLRTAAIMLAVLPVAAVAKTLAYGLRGLGRVVVAQACEVFFRPALVLVTLSGAFMIAPGLRQPDVAMAVQLGAAGGVIAAALWWLRRSVPAVRASTAPEPAAAWIKRAAPFALIGGAGVLTTQTDIVMLGWFRPEAQVGAYRIAQQGGLLTLFGMQAAQSVLAPVFGRLYAEGDAVALRARFRVAARYVFAATVPLAAGLIVFARPIVSVVFGPEYTLAAGPLAILVVGYLVNVAFGPVGVLLQMCGRERLTARVLWATVALNAGFNGVLIPIYGVHGGALATAVAVVVYHGMLRAVAYRDLGV